MVQLNIRTRFPISMPTKQGSEELSTTAVSEALLIPYSALKGVAEAALYCEQEGHLAAPSQSF